MAELPCVMCGKLKPKAQMVRQKGTNLWVCKGNCEANFNEDYSKGFEVTPFFKVKKK